jgi:hypothetical protein
MPLFNSGVGDEEAEAEDYQGREGARGMGGVGVYGAGGGAGVCGEQAVGRVQELRFVVGRPGHFVSVQVKSTVCRSGGGYECCIKGKKDEPYESGSFDFLAAYVVLEDAWYILPAGKVAGRETVCLFSKSKYARYEDYQEAWQLLRDASEIRDAESGVEEVSVAEPARVEPSSAMGRMEAAAKFFMRSLERANVIPGKGGKS